MARGEREPQRDQKGGFVAALLVCALGLPSQAAEPVKEGAAEKKDPAVLEQFTIEKGGRPILAPVRIQERDYLFYLDTGASVCVFDASLRRILGKPIHVREVGTAGGPTTVEVFNPPEAFVGELDLREGGPVVCRDMEMVRRATGRDIRGMLGMGFLKQYVIRIDFDFGKLQFRSWDGREHPEWGIANRLYTSREDAQEVLYVKGNPAGVGEVQFMVDTGESGVGCLGAEVFERATDQRALAEGLSETFGGTRRFKVARISGLTIGGVEHRGVAMHEARENLIGLGLLSRYVVTLDFIEMKMYLRKGQAFDKPNEIDMSGLHLWRLEGRPVVHSVDKDSPAEAAGIKAEDVVLKVGEKKTAEVDICDLRDLLKSGDGKEIKMTVKRGGEEKAVSFRLK